MPLLPLKNFWILKYKIQKYYQNEFKFNGVYSRNSLPKITDGAYVINLDEYKSIGTQWIALHGNGNNRKASYDTIVKGKRLLDYISLFPPSHY